MKVTNIFKTAAVALASLALLTGCVKSSFQEITELALSRCLEPQNLSARVDVATGDNVTFGWDVNKDADSYTLVVYNDEEMTHEVLNQFLKATEVPYTVRLEADQKYTFKVQAMSEIREPSNWAVFDGSAKTYAVKDNLFLEVTDRTETSISLAWSKDVSDYKEVTHISATPVKGGDPVKMDLTSAQATAAAATISGLKPSTEYQVVLFYLSASRGALDLWTKAEAGAAVRIGSSDELKTAVATGGTFYLPISGSPYSMGTAKPASSLSLIGEIGPDGSRPVVVGKVEITDALASGSSFSFEGITFDGDAANSRIVEHTGGALSMERIEFLNCGITNFMAGLFYDNNDNVLHVGEIRFDTCDIFANLGSGGDAFDVRKPCEFDKIVFRNNTIYDGIRTMFRIDAVDGVKISAFEFSNNTVKNIATIDDGNNRGFFAIRVATEMTLKKNLFLYEDGGKTGEDVDKAQLFQDNANTVVPTLTASDNYAFACGKDFFKKVSAGEAGFAVLDADPCYNSKGNFFQLSNQDLISKKIGASKWWISYVEKAEDLTQGFMGWFHTWNLQDASLFAGEVKNSRVRDGLLLVGTEATPMNADGGIHFLAPSVLTRKGVPTEGYVAFKVDRAGSVDFLLSDPEKTGASVVVALADDNGFAVKGGAVASAYAPEVEKVLIPDVKGEGMVYLYATGPVTITKLAWSADVIGGNHVLATPKPVVDPVTLTEGDETPVTITWDHVLNADKYIVVFNKRASEPQDEASFTVPAEDIAALKAGLYNITVQALPREDDIYYTKSEQGAASIAIQPKGGAGEVVNVDLVWDFSAADWQEQFAAYGASGADITNWDISYDGLTIHSGSKSKYAASYFQFGGKSGEMDRYFQFTAPEQGTLKITVSNTGSSEALDRTVQVAVGDDVQSLPGGYPSTSPTEIEFSVKAGEVVITAPVNGLRFYKIEFHCTMSSGGASVVEYDWDFSASDWQDALGALGAVNTDITNIDLTVEGLLFHSGSKSKYNTTYIQFGGKSGDMDRYFKFTAPEQGTLKITVSNTGSAEAMDRTVRVAVGDDVQAQPGGFGKSTPGELEYSVKAGEVVITAPENGLCFYRIYYTNQ